MPQRTLQNYANGEWIAGTGKSAELFNAVTGEVIGETSSGGLDFAAMAAYARTVGGPALRRMTFHERALMLKALAKYLMERKEEFYALSALPAPRERIRGSTLKAASAPCSLFRAAGAAICRTKHFM